MEMLSKKRNSFFRPVSYVFRKCNLQYTCQSSKKKKIEMPVFEDVQMGLSLGMALNGYVPISCFPRFDF